MSSRTVTHAMPASAARALSRARGPLVLAISGGLDSMALLQMAAKQPGVKKRSCVATFDHGTGLHAARAARLVRARARALGIPVVSGRATKSATTEAEWRDMRWQFLRAVAARRGATIVTAHTRDDQIETVVMRILRGASARGLAALYANSPIVRPLLGVRRSTLERYALETRLAFVEDPTNSNPRYLRNRVRRDLLPAFRAAHPTFDGDLLALSRRAAVLRRQVERVARQLSRRTESSVELDVAAFGGLDRDGIAILWPAFVARLGVALDRRGVQRATDFSLKSRTGNRAQCSGGIRLHRTRSAVVITREDSPSASSPTVDGGRAVEPLREPPAYLMDGAHAG